MDGLEDEGVERKAREGKTAEGRKGDEGKVVECLRRLG